MLGFHRWISHLQQQPQDHDSIPRIAPRMCADLLRPRSKLKDQSRRGRDARTFESDLVEVQMQVSSLDFSKPQI